MNRWSCNFSGECEQTADGAYHTVEQCQAACQGAEQKDLLYIIGSYEPASALFLASSDQRRVLQELLGFRLPPELNADNIDDILYYLISESYPALFQYSFLHDWIQERVTVQEWWAIQFLSVPDGYPLNWKVIALDLHITLQYGYQVRREPDRIVKESVLRMLAQQLKTVELQAVAARTLERLWPEMREMYSV